ncbi:MAG: hypothetical protein LBJ00_08845 [Planctomycetaceae bacterium]|nr:hypothetical protein [Planctomycetaceae bacterium]
MTFYFNGFNFLWRDFGQGENAVFDLYSSCCFKIPEAQQREVAVQGRSLSPYRLRYIFCSLSQVFFLNC